MPAQKKPAQNKGSRKPTEPTSIKDVLKAKKLPAKGSKKTNKKVIRKKKVAKKVEPVFTEAMFEKHFFALSPKVFKQMCDEWNEVNLKIKITKQPDYDHWINYWKTLPASHIRTLVVTAQDILDAEAYSALRMWHDIISNPQRIAKIHQTSLSGPKAKEGRGIVAMALKNDRMGVLMATRDKLAEKLDKGAGARDTAALARELTDVMTAISDYEKRLGPKKETMLAKLIDGMPGAGVRNTSKKPAKAGEGRRKTSFAARVTIKDIEANQ